MNIMSLINPAVCSITELSDYEKEFFDSKIMLAVFIVAILWIVVFYLKDYQRSLYERIKEKERGVRNEQE
ncbi:MAG: hypothetical protein IKH21_02005 [Clostridia bacterium]|nr:hypothetical protein [Clostridia bacterium]